jgi:hypothetical protein
MNKFKYLILLILLVCAGHYLDKEGPPSRCDKIASEISEEEMEIVLTNYMTMGIGYSDLRTLKKDMCMSGLKNMNYIERLRFTLGF